jgi:Domain of unknown function (DUF4274)
MHPNCDAGTALMLYWMGSPEFVHENGSCDDSDKRDIANLEYIKEIERNFLHGLFPTSKIEYVPQASTSYKKNTWQYRWIPCGMFRSTPGKPVKPLKWKWTWTQDDHCRVILK